MNTTLLTLKNITYSYGEKVVLENINLSLIQGERIFVVGENGSGKSTLFKIINQNIFPETGNIIKQNHIRSYYVTQEFDEDKNLTLEEYIIKKQAQNVIKKIFDIGISLGFSIEKKLKDACKSISGGQQKILMLSIGIALNPHILLLDEPENHLDIVSRFSLIGILQNFKGAILFISHDRLSIDSLSEKIAEMDKGKLFITEGNYQDYIEARLSRIEGMQREWQKKNKRIDQLKNVVRILGKQAFRGHNTAEYHKRKEELENLKKIHTDKPEDRKTKINLLLNNKTHEGKLLCKIDNMSFTYSHEKPAIFKNIDLEIRSGSKIVLIGRNGIGKSTFFKCLMGEINNYQGNIKWSENCKKSYLDQNIKFEDEETPLSIIKKELYIDNENARAVLGSVKISGNKVETKIKLLSGGEKMRIKFAIAFASQPDFLICDEPTNHLDEVTWEILLDVCKKSKITLLIVTHDYEFIKELEPSFFWILHNKNIKESYKDIDEVIEEIGG